MIRVLIFILVLVGAFLFMIENTEQTVQIRYFIGTSTPPIPVYQLVAGAFIAGMLLVGLFKRREVRFFNPPRPHYSSMIEW